ncbi:MAG: hypothetical protein P9L99_07625 [Candidatus Lernaella stagnicola]|nr:hypothetical protein [Candidatus Lernaella stagnicola]
MEQLYTEAASTISTFIIALLFALVAFVALYFYSNRNKASKANGKPEGNIEYVSLVLPKNKIIMAVVIVVTLFFVAGFLRLYYGGGIGLKVLPKHSFGFTDTVVNLDDLLGMPRIVFAATHPAVKRQLEEIGFLQTDEELKEEIMREMNETIQQNLRDFGL